MGKIQPKRTSKISIEFMVKFSYFACSIIALRDIIVPEIKENVKKAAIYSKKYYF